MKPETIYLLNQRMGLLDLRMRMRPTDGNVQKLRQFADSIIQDCQDFKLTLDKLEGEPAVLPTHKGW